MHCGFILIQSIIQICKIVRDFNRSQKKPPILVTYQNLFTAENVPVKVRTVDGKKKEFSLLREAIIFKLDYK